MVQSDSDFLGAFVLNPHRLFALTPMVFWRRPQGEEDSHPSRLVEDHPHTIP